MGYIKIDRKLKDWQWKTNPNTLALWIHILLEANYEDRTWKGIEVPKGTLITSLKSLSEKTGLTVQQTRTALSNIQTTHEITIKSTNKYTLITVNKWEQYQGSSKTTTNKITNKKEETQQTNNTQINNTIRNKEIKNKEIEEEDINIIRSFLVEDFTEARVIEAEKLLSDYPHTIHDVGRLAEQLTKGIINKKGYVYKMMKGKYETKNI